MGQVICFNALIDNLVCAVSLDSRLHHCNYFEHPYQCRYQPLGGLNNGQRTGPATVQYQCYYQGRYDESCQRNRQEIGQQEMFRYGSEIQPCEGAGGYLAGNGHCADFPYPSGTSCQKTVVIDASRPQIFQPWKYECDACHRRI